MIDYSSLPNTQGGAFPSTQGKDASTPTSFDGTPYNEIFIDDLWGANQALMSYAGLTPSGSAESASVSQRLEAMKLCFGYPGMLVPMFINHDPATLGIRVLLCEGQGVLVASYPELDAACYVGDGNNALVHGNSGFFYRASDAAGTTPNIAGPYLILPDASASTIKGVESGDSVGDVMVEGVETQQLQAHTHSIINSLSSRMLESSGSVKGDGTVTTFAFESANTNPALFDLYEATTMALVSGPGAISATKNRMQNFPVKIGVIY